MRSAKVRCTSLDPRPKPLMMGPERRIGNGGSGPLGGPAKAGRGALGGVDEGREEERCSGSGDDAEGVIVVEKVKARWELGGAEWRGGGEERANSVYIKALVVPRSFLRFTDSFLEWSPISDFGFRISAT